MHSHHDESIQNVVKYFQNEPEVEALVLGGSLAHGYASPVSDIDIMIIITDQHYAKRLSEGNLQFFDRELCTYPEGYVDGKYLGMSHLTAVAEKGSCCRYAFQDARCYFHTALIDEANPFDRLLSSHPQSGAMRRLRSIRSLELVCG